MKPHAIALAVAALCGPMPPAPRILSAWGAYVGAGGPWGAHRRPTYAVPWGG